MKDRKKYLHNRDILLNEHKGCQKCGRTIGLEVHHIKPQSEGGSDEIENLQVLCGVCHNDIHKYNKGELTKKGLERAKHKKCEALISKYDFYMELQSLLDNEDKPDVSDILDIIDNLPIKGRYEIKK